jgi:hypothetical protein
MSKNSQISELINYISVNGSGDIVMTGNLIMPGGAQAATQSYVTTAISNLVASAPSTLDTLNELATALGNDANFATTIATSIGTKQSQLNGTGFVKITGTTVLYDNSTYLTTSSASSTYLPLSGGTLTGALNAPSASFSGAASVINTFNLYKTGGTTLGGQLAYDSSVNQLYLWNNVSSGYFSIYTNSTERLTITSVGNVGIGTSNPFSKLDVSTSISQAICVGNNSDTITNGDLIGALSFVSRDASTYSSGGVANIRSYATSTYNTGNISGDLRFYVSNGLQNINAAALFGTEAMRITNEGKVGIGTINPGYKLTVVTDSTAALLVQASGATVGSPIIDFYDNGRAQETVITSTDGTTTGTYIASYSNHPLMFGAAAGTSPTTKMTIATNGNVGIGTSSPNSRLDLGGGYGSSGEKFFIYNDNNSSALAGTKVGFYMDRFGLANNSTYVFPTAAAAPGSYIIASKDTGGTTLVARMTILGESGNVGIGTVSPTSTLHIGASTGGNQKLTHWGEPGFTANYGLILRGNSADGVFKFHGLNNGSETNAPILAMNRASANSTFGGTYISTYSRLNVEGSTKINRSIYNWYQGGWSGNSTYWHMKTNMYGGSGGNTMYTMSLFKGYMYSYGSVSALEGTYGFHNWSGTIYSAASSGNLFTTAYVSSDGYVVLVVPSGSGETGVTIDWHQAYGYPFVDATVTHNSLHSSPTGRY